MSPSQMRGLESGRPRVTQLRSYEQNSSPKPRSVQHPQSPPSGPTGSARAHCQMKTLRLRDVKAMPQAAASTYPISNCDEGPGVQVPGWPIRRMQPREPQGHLHPSPERRSKPAWHGASPIPRRRCFSRHLSSATEHLLCQAQGAAIFHL